MNPVPSTWYDQVFSDTVQDHTKLLYFKRHLRCLAGHCVGSILDLGCGLGLLADMVGNSYYLGVDFSSFAIDYARGHTQNKRAVFIRADLKEFIQQQLFFDTIVISEILEHIDFPILLAGYAIKNYKQRLIGSVPTYISSESHIKASWSKEDIFYLFGKNPSYLMQDCTNGKRKNIHWHFTYSKEGA